MLIFYNTDDGKRAIQLRAQQLAFPRIEDHCLFNLLNNQKQNQELAALRDWLLPMLMNSQVTGQ